MPSYQHDEMQGWHDVKVAWFNKQYICETDDDQMMAKWWPNLFLWWWWFWDGLWYNRGFDGFNEGIKTNSDNFLGGIWKQCTTQQNSVSTFIHCYLLSNIMSLMNEDLSMNLG